MISADAKLLLSDLAIVALTLIASIPLLGGLLGPLLIAFGLTSGALADLKEGAIRPRGATLEAEFRTVTV